MPRPRKKQGKNLPAAPKDIDPRWDEALSYLVQGEHPVTACKRAGFGETYSVCGAPQKLKRMLLSRATDVLDQYKGSSLANLSAIGEAERQMVNHLAREGNFQELPKFAAIVKQIKQSAGALAQEVESSRPVLVQVALNIQAHFSKGLDDDAITVQVSEPKKGDS